MARECGEIDPREAIAEIRDAYMAAFNAGRIDDVMELHAEDVISMPAGVPPMEGRDALRELTAESFDTAPDGFHFAFEMQEVRVADGWAVERGVTRAYLDEEPGGIPGGKYVLLYEREDDGCWRIAWSITNSDRPQ